MINTKDLIASFSHEVAVCKHLASKIPADKYEFTPGEGMRTIEDLLQYITRMGSTSFALLDGYDPEQMKAMRIASEEGNVKENFDAMMDEQLASMIGFLESATPEYMEEEIELFGSTQPRKGFVLNMALKNFPAYRMQLFQYLKGGLGMTELNTSNLWMGMDPQAHDA